MLTLDIKRSFANLVAQVSPENLTCDGELSDHEVKHRLKQIRLEWQKLEAQAGSAITETDVWGWSDELHEAAELDRQTLMALQPQHPLVTPGNPGVWSRKGQNGLTAYYIQNYFYYARESLIGKADEFMLYSEFASIMHRREQIGVFSSLDAAVEAAETFLKTITRESLQAALPAYTPANLNRVLERLPQEI